MKTNWIFWMFVLFPLVQVAQEPEYNHVFFDNSLMEKSWFYSEASYESPGFVLNVEGRLPVENNLSFTPGNSLQLKYTSVPEGNWTVRLQYPESRGKGFIKSGDFLSFWIYVPDKTTQEGLPEVAVAIKDKTVSGYKPMSAYLSDYARNKWIQAKIPLNDFRNSAEKNLSYSHTKEILNVLFRQSASDEGEHEIFIDQVEILPEDLSKTTLESPVIEKAEGYERHIDLTWEKVEPELIRYVKIYRSEDNENFSPVGVQSPKEFSRYVDYTGVPGKTYYYKISNLGYDYSESALSESVKAETREMNDEELLDMVQEACFRYYWDAAEPESGLALENIPGRKNMIATGASGFGMMAMIVGVERGFISRDEFTARMERIISFIEQGDRFYGALPHFMDGPSGKVEPFFGQYDDGADLVETSFFMQGLLTVEQFLSKNDPKEKKLRERISQIWEGVEWNWFRKTEDSSYLYWHWSPEHTWHINHKLIGWNETMITYFLAIASPTHGIPADMYYSGWASQEIMAQDYRSDWGKTSAGSLYSNETTYFGIPLQVGVGSGGPLFFTHYSFLGLDPRKMEDQYTNYFENNRDIVLINYRYCCENPGNFAGYGQESWGLTASDGPWGYKAREAKIEMDDGTIAPTGAISSFPYTPEKSMEALKHFYRENGSFLWGEYGFRDAFNVSEDWTADIFMGLNQAPMVVMIENHRTGLLWNLFMKNEAVRDALKEIKNAE